MREITAQNAAEYLRASGRAKTHERIEVRELAGGVSNVVLYVQQGESAFVLKQARPQLRVAQPWFCPVERNWRELAVLRVCETLLSRSSKITTPCAADEIAARTPAVLWEDRDNYVFAMQAAPTDHVVWKQQLLANGAESKSLPNNLRIAAACGKLLAELHAASWQDELLCEQLGDVSLFDALRIDPYYRTVAAANASLRQPLEQLTESLPQNRLSLVHADFSPKNLLVYERSGRTELMMVDFETGHFGDPAFDLGFFLSHLTLKALWSAPSSASFRKLADAFWATYFAARGDLDAQAQALLARRAMFHLGACVVARVDGKSPVEYLVDPASRDAARAFGSDLLLSPKSGWNEVVL